MINKIKYPERIEWPQLIQRPAEQPEQLEILAKEIFDTIRKDGDQAVKMYMRRFEGTDTQPICVHASVIANAREKLPAALCEAITLAAANIRRFHQSQVEKVKRVDTMPGVTCWRESRAIERVGIYIPGGSAPLFSTVLMLAIPATLAGCKEIVLCTPAGESGSIDPAILFAASITGVKSVFAIGGMQAIAAMASGTESVPKVDKIFGPGNQYVTAAKTFAQRMGVPIDLPAGPSEVLIIADKTASPAFVAADLLSQAEHGADSQVMLLSDSESLINATLKELVIQIECLPRKEIAARALSTSRCILMKSLEECYAFSDLYAPEHLIVATDDPEVNLGAINNAGSVFLGHYSCESAGDYASGTNHTLPTNGFARGYSGVSLDSFVKKITFQRITKDGIATIGPAIQIMAEAEKLQAHKEAVSIRLKTISNN